jgi:hypothetical protein
MHDYVFAQDYKDLILDWRRKQWQELADESRLNFELNDSNRFHYFAPNDKFRVLASVIYTDDTTIHVINTYSGTQKEFYHYCTFAFKIGGKKFTLNGYMSAAHRDEIFVPFKDDTNYEMTYGGGRYIDVPVADIKTETVLLDFNKAYNPYCAYASGFNCPIPPNENRLRTMIKAGEKLFAVH